MGEGFVLDQGWKIESMLVRETEAADHMASAAGKQRERNECLTHVLLIQFGALACRMALPTFRV